MANKRISGTEVEQLFGNVMSLVDQHGDQLDDKEGALATDILCRLVPQMEREFRLAVAERLADNPDAPHRLVVLLANDEFSVAEPVLEHSPVLRDGDLVRIVRFLGFGHRMAVSRRESLAAAVCRAIVATDDGRVIASLLTNRGADIPIDTLGRLVGDARTTVRYREPLVHRHDLPLYLAAQLYSWISDALQQELARRFAGDDLRTLSVAIFETEKNFVEQTTGASAMDDEAAGAPPTRQRRTVDRQQVYAWLCDGEMAVFEAGLAELTGATLAKTRELIADTSGTGLALLCKAAGFQEAFFCDIYRRISHANGGSVDLGEAELARLQQLYRSRSAARARAMIAWRADPA